MENQSHFLILSDSIYSTGVQLSDIRYITADQAEIPVQYPEPVLAKVGLLNTVNKMSF